MGGPRRLFGRLLQFYNGILHRHKYPVQIVTGGVLWFTGDILCQSLVHASATITRHPELQPTSEAVESQQTPTGQSSRPSGFSIDWMRAGRMTCYGLVVSAPVYAFWYSYLDRWSHRFFANRAMTTQNSRAGSAEAVIIPAPLRHFLQRFPTLAGLFRPPLRRVLERLPAASTRRIWEIIGFKLAADCFLFDPAYLVLFFSTTNAMEGRTLGEIGAKLRADLPTTYLVDVAVWLPIQTVNFRWVPVVYQALFVQSCNIGWNAYLSFVQHHNHTEPHLNDSETRYQTLGSNVHSE